MIAIRKAEERGHLEHGWLDTYHTFSFTDYYDPAHIHFRTLRVMNEDRIAPGQGFGTHPHRDMEIVTYVLEGALEHKDSMGNGEVLRAGEFQHMTAGRGITHSEFNPSPTEPVHLYQIWILPTEKGLEPGYDQKRFAPEERENQWQLVASPEAESGALVIHQDARIYLANLTAGGNLDYAIDPSRHVWLQVLRGSVKLGEQTLAAGDGVALSDEPALVLQTDDIAEVMLFDLA